MRAFSLGLALLALTAGGAAAACRCACVDGELRSLCNGPLDPPALCDRLCPLSVRPPGAPPEIPSDLLADDTDPTAPTGDTRGPAIDPSLLTTAPSNPLSR